MKKISQLCLFLYAPFFYMYSLAAPGPIGDGNGQSEESTEKKELFSIYGNSISTYEGYIPTDFRCWFTEEQMNVEETWWYQVGEAMHWKLCNNSSWSGSRVAYDRDWEYNSYFISPYRLRNLSENGNPNYILVLGGVNDWRWSLCELGTVDNTDSTSFCGAYNLMLDRLKLYHPNSKIFCISILPISEGGNTIHSVNSMGWSISQANECIKGICNKKKVCFLDLSPCSFGDDVSENTADGLHPNVQGMKMIADFIVTKLKELYETTNIKSSAINKHLNEEKYYGMNGVQNTGPASRISLRRNGKGKYIKILSK